MNQEPEDHAFGTYASSGSEILIIGTFPTAIGNRDFEFFYPNPDNAFWKIMSGLYHFEFQHFFHEDAVIERKIFVDKHKIALTDMLAKAFRIDGKSTDKHIIPHSIMDILGILKDHPSINRIILTSRSGENNALDLFSQHLGKNGIQLHTKKADDLITGWFSFAGKQYKVFVPFSPSPRVVRTKGLPFLQEMFRRAMFLE
jgi:hypoxanthine-DNA glycosylase